MNQRQERVRKASKPALDGLLGVLGLPSFRKDFTELFFFIFFGVGRIVLFFFYFFFFK
jgi:hypothetical protein